MTGRNLASIIRYTTTKLSVCYTNFVKGDSRRWQFFRRDALRIIIFFHCLRENFFTAILSRLYLISDSSISNSSKRQSTWLRLRGCGRDLGSCLIDNLEHPDRCRQRVVGRLNQSVRHVSGGPHSLTTQALGGSDYPAVVDELGNWPIFRVEDSEITGCRVPRVD